MLWSLLPLALLLAPPATSWDVVTTIEQKIHYFNKDGTLEKTENCTFKDLKALTYDAAYNQLLYADDKNENGSVFSILKNNRIPLVRPQNSDTTYGVAFDPVTDSLFWSDSLNKIIYKMNITDSKSNGYGDVLIQLDEGTPTSIAVDSCRGHIYWTNIIPKNSRIERTNLDGTDRKVIIGTDPNYAPVGIVIDLKSQRLYWAESSETTIHFKLETSDLNGNDRRTIIKDINLVPKDIAIGEHDVYWSDKHRNCIWKASKNATEGKPIKFVDGTLAVPNGLAVKNYLNNIPECGALNDKLIHSNPFMFQKALEKLTTGKKELACENYCLSGTCTINNGNPECSCSAGHTGARCSVDLCSGHCLNGGSCSYTLKQLECACPDNFTGDRCETKREQLQNKTDKEDCSAGHTGARCSVDLCSGHCLNGGSCSYTMKQLVCACPENFTGDRCETKREQLQKMMEKESCNCPVQNAAPKRTSPLDLGTTDGLFFESPCLSNELDWRSTIIMVLGGLCGCLTIACAVLVTKVLQLKKRPRIRKRIIVNKNVTPLTARPEQQCEITIENCCNMNICETPCFEPRSTIRPSLLGAKSGKDEKKNLIANMEHPDDMY